MKTKEQLIRRLHYLRKHNWEQHILQYGMTFREDKATYQQLANHVRKIEQYRSDYINGIVATIIRFLAILAVFLIILFSHI